MGLAGNLGERRRRRGKDERDEKCVVSMLSGGGVQFHLLREQQII